MADVQHAGTIVSIIGHIIDVELEVRGGCGSCKAKDLCGMVEQETKHVSVWVELTEAYEVGEVVEVSVSLQMGIKAVALAYVAPLIILLLVLILGASLDINEGVAGLAALGAIAIYFLLLKVFRGKIERETTFKINKI